MAERGAHLHGNIRLSHMKRLSDLLLNADGVVDVSLDFHTGDDGVHLVKGTINTRLGMICQRCLKPLHLGINRLFELAFVYSAHEIERLLGSYECYEVHGDEVFVRDMVEDELILSVPQIPVHDSLTDCDAEFISRLGGTNKTTLADNHISSFRELKK